MKKLVIGVGIALAASTLGYITYKLYKNKKICKQEKKIEQENEKRDNPKKKKICKSNAVTKEELEKMCDLWDLIIYQVINSAKQYNQILELQLEHLSKEEKNEMKDKNIERSNLISLLFSIRKRKRNFAK